MSGKGGQPFPPLPAFAGFPPQAPAFLQALRENNATAWFQAHKEDYDVAVAQPLKALLDALTPAMLMVDPDFETLPQRGAIARIRRDVRFSRDKSPYRIHQWLSFKPRTPAWATCPAFFFDFGPDDYCLGMGYYAATPATMTRVRAGIVANTAAFAAAATAAQQADFTVEGPVFKRLPVAPHPLPAPAQAWFTRKTAYLLSRRSLDALFFSPELAEVVQARFLAVAPLYALLSEFSPRLWATGKTEAENAEGGGAFVADSD